MPMHKRRCPSVAIRIQELGISIFGKLIQKWNRRSRNRRSNHRSGAVESLEIRVLPAAVVELVADLNTAPNDLQPNSWPILDQATAGGLTYFTTQTMFHAQTLWRTDGTQAGTFPVFGDAPYSGMNDVWIQEGIGNHLYFNVRALDALRPVELWASDGSKEGTHFVHTGESTSFVPYGDGAVFVSNNGEHAVVYATDGTQAGTRELLTLPGESDIGPISVTAQGRMFVVASHTDPNSPVLEPLSSVWVIDQEGVEPRLLTPTVGPTLNRTINGIAVVGESLYFTGTTDHLGNELWMTDGTAAGTRIVAEDTPGDWGYNLDILGTLGEQVLFRGGTPQTYQSLWAFGPGSNAAVNLTGAARGNVNFYDSMQINDQIFVILDGELWKSDGTVTGTQKIAGTNLVPGLSTTPYFRTMFRRDDSMLLLGLDSEHGSELWFSDGTTEGTQLLKDINVGPENGLQGNPFPRSYKKPSHLLVFGPKEGLPVGRIWITDGTPGNTIPLLINSTGNQDSAPYSLTEHDGELFFASDSVPQGDTMNSLWRVHDGQIEPIGLGGGLYARRGRIYFQKAIDGSSESGLFEWTGTEARRIMVQPESFHPSTLYSGVHGRTIVFGASFEPEFSQQLRVLQDDGSTTVLVSAMHLGVVTITADGILYFVTDNFRDLWRTDGTLAGTIRLSSVELRGPAVTANWSGHETTLFPTFSGTLISDGTVAGTRRLGDLFPIAENDRGLGLLGGNYMFTTYSASDGNSLRKFDGISVQLVSRKVQAPSNPVVIGRTMYFWGSTSPTLSPWALWKTDGTDSGTEMVASFDSATRLRSDITNFTAVGDKLLFYVRENANQLNILWMSDGTTEGTVPLRHTMAGQLVLTEDPAFTRFDGGVAFRAATEESGVELFKISNVKDLQPPPSVTVRSTATELQAEWADVDGAVQFDIQIRDVRNPDAVLHQFRVSQPQFSMDPGLSQGGYRMWIRSVPFLGQPSAWSMLKEFGAGSKPTLNPIVAQSSENRPTFRWVAPTDVVNFDLWLTNRDTGIRALFRERLTSGSFSVIDALPVARYAVWTRGTRADGTKTDWSDLTEFQVLNPPIPLVSGAGDWKTSRPTIAWNAVDGATGYDVLVQAEESSSVVYEAKNLKGLSHVVNEDLPSGRFRIFVRAVRGTQPHSVRGQGTVIWMKLPPTGLRHTLTGVAWDAVPLAVTYSLELRNSRGTLVMPRTTQSSSTFDPATSLEPGQYTLRVFANFQGASSNWSQTYAFELFHPPVQITSPATPTADATPVITWTTAAGASAYEIAVTREGTTALAYARGEISGTSHRIATALPNGQYRIAVRALFPDGSRSTWSAAQRLSIGRAVSITAGSRKLNWDSLSGATHYEVWINLLGTNPRAKIVHQPVQLTTEFTLPATLPKGRYQAWVRAIRAEAGEFYAGHWGTVLFDIR